MPANGDPPGNTTALPESGEVPPPPRGGRAAPPPAEPPRRAKQMPPPPTPAFTATHLAPPAEASQQVQEGEDEGAEALCASWARGLLRDPGYRGWAAHARWCWSQGRGGPATEPMPGGDGATTASELGAAIYRGPATDPHPLPEARTHGPSEGAGPAAAPLALHAATPDACFQAPFGEVLALLPQLRVGRCKALRRAWSNTWPTGTPRERRMSARTRERVARALERQLGAARRMPPPEGTYPRAPEPSEQLRRHWRRTHGPAADGWREPLWRDAEAMRRRGEVPDYEPELSVTWCTDCRNHVSRRWHFCHKARDAPEGPARAETPPARARGLPPGAREPVWCETCRNL
eukprot:gene3762-5226_t